MSFSPRARELVLIQLFDLPSPMAHARQILSTACALAGRGIRVHLFCRMKDERSARLVLHEDFGLEAPESLVLHTFSPIKAIATLVYRRRLLQLVHGASPETVFYGRHRSQTLRVLRMGRFLRRKLCVLFEFHNVEHVLEREKGISKADRVRREEERIVAQCDALAAISQPLAMDLVRVFDCRRAPVVIPDGVDLAGFGGLTRRAPKNGATRLVYAGSLYEHKGVGGLLDALEHLDGHVQLTIVGGNPPGELERLRARAAESAALAGRVEFVGHVEARAVPGQLARGDLILLPAGQVLRTQRYASPLKLFEAMATGIPIVAAPADSLTSVLEDGVTAFIAPDGTGPGLAQGIRNALARPRAAVSIGRRAAAAAVDYGWDRRAERILALAGDALAAQHEAPVPGLQRQ